MARSKKTGNEKDAVETVSSEPLELESPTDVMAEAEDAEISPPLAEEAEKTTETVSSPEASQTRRAGIIPYFLGGAVVAALAVGAVQYFENDRWPFPSQPTAADELAIVVASQKSEIQELRDQITGLTESLGGLPGAADVDHLRVAQQELDDSVSGLAVTLGELSQRMTDVENRPIPDIGATADAVATYERELAAMRKMFEEELARIEAAQEQAVATEKNAAERAENATERALIAQITAAIESGADIREHLDALSGAGIEVPDGLWDAANAGVPSLTKLQSDFSDVARAALNAAIRGEAESGRISGLSAFLRTQLGTRSLEAKEGDDPDAVLSRAEAALRSGDIGKTLSELQAMPSAADAELAPWIAAANRRQMAVAAITAMAETFNE